MLCKRNARFEEWFITSVNSWEISSEIVVTGLYIEKYLSVKNNKSSYLEDRLFIYLLSLSIEGLHEY